MSRREDGTKKKETMLSDGITSGIEVFFVLLERNMKGLNQVFHNQRTDCPHIGAHIYLMYSTWVANVMSCSTLASKSSFLKRTSVVTRKLFIRLCYP